MKMFIYFIIGLQRHPSSILTSKRALAVLPRPCLNVFIAIYNIIMLLNSIIIITFNKAFFVITAMPFQDKCENTINIVSHMHITYNGEILTSCVERTIQLFLIFTVNVWCYLCQKNLSDLCHKRQQ